MFLLFFQIVKRTDQNRYFSVHTQHVDVREDYQRFKLIHPIGQSSDLLQSCKFGHSRDISFRY